VRPLWVLLILDLLLIYSNLQPPPMHIGLQAPSPSSGAFPASPKPPLPLAGGSRRSYRYRAGRARFLVSRAKPRAPRPRFQPPQPFKRPLSRIWKPPTTAIQRFPAGPTDIEPSGLDCRSRALNPPPLRIPGSSPSSSSMRLSPAT
jgi:hypothetical protein